MTANQLKEWMEYDALEPIGIQGHLIGHATTAATLANANRDSKQRKEPFTIVDFLPETFKPPKKEMSNKEAALAFKQLLLSRNKGTA